MASRDWWPLFRSVRTSRKLAQLPDDECRLFWFYLGPACDSWGRISADPHDLADLVWPALRKPPEAAARCLKALAAARLVSLYRGADRRRYVQLSDHERHAGLIGEGHKRGLSECADPPGFVAPAKWIERAGRISPWIGAPEITREKPSTLDSVETKSRPSRARGEERRPKRTPKSSLQDLGTPVPDGGSARPAGAGRPPATASSSEPVKPRTLVTPATCPHCHGPTRQEPLVAESQFCTDGGHEAFPVSGVRVLRCVGGRKPGCREYFGPRVPFGPQSCARCAAARVAVAKSAGAA